MWKVIQVTWHPDLHFQVQGKKLSFCNYFPAQTYKNQRKKSLFNTHHTVQHQIHTLCHFFRRGLDFPLVLIIHFLPCCQEDASPGHSLFCCFKTETLFVLPLGLWGSVPASNPANLAPLLDFILCNNIDLSRSVDIVCNLSRVATQSLLPSTRFSLQAGLPDTSICLICALNTLPGHPSCLSLAGGVGAIFLPINLSSAISSFIISESVLYEFVISGKCVNFLLLIPLKFLITQDGIILSILVSH